MEKHVAIIVAGGSGSRMQSDIPKQYLDLNGRSVLGYSLHAFDRCPFICETVLVVSESYLSYVKEEILDKEDFQKQVTVVCGGKERSDSVYQGLLAAGGADYVYIHDAARPYLTQEMLERAKAVVEEEKAMTFAVPVKDTVKVADQNTIAIDTLDRSLLWNIQTPQVFSYPLIKNAFDTMLTSGGAIVTDDTMVAERFGGAKVKLVMGSYSNLKITTPEDLVMMQAILTSEGR